MRLPSLALVVNIESARKGVLVTIHGIKTAPAALLNLLVKYDLLLFVLGLFLALVWLGLFGAHRADAALKPPKCKETRQLSGVQLTCDLDRPGSFVVVGRSTAGYRLSWKVSCSRKVYGDGKLVNGPFQMVVSSDTAPRAYELMARSRRCLVTVAARAQQSAQPHRIFGLVKWVHYFAPRKFND